MGLKIKTTASQQKVKVSSTTIPVSFDQKDENLDVDLHNVISMIDVDQSYDPESKNAQSGKAVAEAIKEGQQTNANSVKYVEQNLTIEQQQRARDNIDAASKTHSHTFIPDGEISKPNVITETTSVEAVTDINTTAARMASAYDDTLGRVTIDFKDGEIEAKKAPVLQTTYSYLDSPPIFVGREITTDAQEGNPDYGIATIPYYANAYYEPVEDVPGKLECETTELSSADGSNMSELLKRLDTLILLQKNLNYYKKENVQTPKNGLSVSFE